MELKITNIRAATDDEWDSIWKNCDYATYFHSREWAEIFQEYTKDQTQPTAKLITFSDDKIALLPFSSKNYLKGFVTQCISSPQCTFGGWLSLDSLSDTHIDFLIDYIMTNYQNIMWRLNPYDPTDLSKKFDYFVKDSTQVLKLDCGFIEIYKDWTKKHKDIAQNARKALKIGVSIKKADSSDEWEEYFNIYLESLKRWGSSVSSRYEWQLFKNIFDLSSSNIKLWTATYQNKIVSGALCFYAKKHIAYWHGASLSDYFWTHPVHLLLYEIIKDACNHEFRWFDFNPSGGHKGVEEFKSRFGTVKIACPLIIRKKLPLKIIEQKQVKRLKDLFW